MGRTSNIFSNHRNAIGYFRFKWFGKSQPSFRFELRNGVSLEVPRRMLHTYKEIFFDDTYFKAIPNLPQGNDSLNIMDVGANVGYFSFFALLRYPGSKVLAVEPMPQNITLFKKYLADNKGQDIQLLQAAAGGQTGKLKLFFDKSDSFTTSATIFFDSGQRDELEVDMLSLPDLISKAGWNKVDFLKLDCEGSEYDVIYECPDATLAKIDRLAIETHKGERPGQSRDELVAFLRGKGYVTETLRSKIWAWRP